MDNEYQNRYKLFNSTSRSIPWANLIGILHMPLTNQIWYCDWQVPVAILHIHYRDSLCLESQAESSLRNVLEFQFDQLPQILTTLVKRDWASKGKHSINANEKVIRSCIYTYDKQWLECIIECHKNIWSLNSY